MSNHLSALIYAAKFLNRNAAPDYKDVAIIRRLRTQARILQKEGDVERPQTKEDLQAQNRWLPWEEIVTAVRTQREKFELTVPAKPKARECADLLLLSIYVFIPPSRGLEIRTLEIVGEEESLEARKDTARNLLIQMANGDIRLHFSNFKTRKFVGRDELALGREDELCRLMNVYIKDHRPKLVTASSQRYLLLNKNGDMYTAAAFSAHMKTVLFGLTGKLASVNVLRSSFITWAYGKEDCTDAMKNSLAAALRHSRDQAQRTYDRRTANEKKNMAVGLAKRCARGQLDSDSSDSQTECEQEEQDQDTPSSNASIKPGQFVGLVDDNSTWLQPRVWIAQVQSLANRQASLLWYKRVAANTYKLELTGTDWKESLDSLVPVEMQAKKDASGTYKLLASTRSIHKAVMNSR